jgi:hypothetical protein
MKFRGMFWSSTKLTAKLSELMRKRGKQLAEVSCLPCCSWNALMGHGDVSVLYM